MAAADVPALVPYAFLEEREMFKCLMPGPTRFDEPFFYDSILKHKHSEGQQQITLRAADLPETQTEKTVPLNLLIFHISRCGSTLLTQMLSQSDKNIVLSEPMVVDELLRSNLTVEKKKSLIRKCVNLLGQQKSGKEKYMTIKLDSWHIIYLPLLKEIFSDAKILFLFREPGPVVFSHQKFRGRQMVPGVLKNICLTEDSAAFISLDDYTMQVLATFYKEMIVKANSADFLLDYAVLMRELPALLKACDMVFEPEDYQLVMQRAVYHSKEDSRKFTGDGSGCDIKQRDKAHMKQLYEYYEQLLSLKKSF